MKILMIGVSGLIDHAAADNLKRDLQAIRASRHSGDIHVDIPASRYFNQHYSHLL